MPRPIFVRAHGNEMAHWATAAGNWVPRPGMRQTWGNPGGGLPPGSPVPMHVGAHRIIDPMTGLPRMEKAHWALPGGHWIANPNLPAPPPPPAAAPQPLAMRAAAATVDFPGGGVPVNPGEMTDRTPMVPPGHWRDRAFPSLYDDTGGPVPPGFPTVEGPPRRVKRRKGKR